MRREDREAIDAANGLLLVLIIAGLIVTVLGFLTSCGPAAIPPVPTKVVTVTVTERCSKTPPPLMTPVPRPSVCMPGLICWRVEDAAHVADNVERLLEWQRAEWALCNKGAP